MGEPVPLLSVAILHVNRCTASGAPSVSYNPNLTFSRPASTIDSACQPVARIGCDHPSAALSWLRTARGGPTGLSRVSSRRRDFDSCRNTQRYISAGIMAKVSPALSTFHQCPALLSIPDDARIDFSFTPRLHRHVRHRFRRYSPHSVPPERWP